MKTTNYGFVNTVDLSFNKAIERVTTELQKEGFGILTEIDVKSTLKKKLDVDFTEYRILGACNPPFAYQALQAEEEIGLLLPCNVIIYVNSRQETVVAAVDPAASMQAVDNDLLKEIAPVIQEKLIRAIKNV